jgi:hypothetical protein
MTENRTLLAFSLILIFLIPISGFGDEARNVPQALWPAGKFLTAPVIGINRPNNGMDNTGTTNGQVYFTPVIVPANATISGIAIPIITVAHAQANIRFAIYASKSDGSGPGTLLIDAGEAVGPSQSNQNNTMIQVTFAKPVKNGPHDVWLWLAFMPRLDMAGNALGCSVTAAQEGNGGPSAPVMGGSIPYLNYNGASALPSPGNNSYWANLAYGPFPQSAPSPLAEFQACTFLIGLFH